MERLIVLPEKSDVHVQASQIPRILEDGEGIVLVYEREDITGSIMFINGRFIMSLIGTYEEACDLETLMVDYPELTFKLIT